MVYIHAYKCEVCAINIGTMIKIKCQLHARFYSNLFQKKTNFINNFDRNKLSIIFLSKKYNLEKLFIILIMKVIFEFMQFFFEFNH